MSEVHNSCTFKKNRLYLKWLFPPKIPIWPASFLYKQSGGWVNPLLGGGLVARGREGGAGCGGHSFWWGPHLLVGIIPFGGGHSMWCKPSLAASKWRARCVCALSPGVYPAGKLRWQFTCGFDFRHGLWLPFGATFAVQRGLLMVSVRTMGLCWSGMALSWLGGLVGCVWGWGFGACGSRLPGLAFSGWAGVLMGSVDSRELGVRASTSRFILLVRFSDTLLLVSILDMVYDCHLRPLLQSWRV